MLSFVSDITNKPRIDAFIETRFDNLLSNWVKKALTIAERDYRLSRIVKFISDNSENIIKRSDGFYVRSAVAIGDFLQNTGSIGRIILDVFKSIAFLYHKLFSGEQYFIDLAKSQLSTISRPKHVSVELKAIHFNNLNLRTFSSPKLIVKGTNDVLQELELLAKKINISAMVYIKESHCITDSKIFLERHNKGILHLNSSQRAHFT